MKTAKWIQFLAVPLGIAEQIFHSPTPFWGISIEAIAQLGQIGLTHLQKKNNWINLVR